MGGRFVQFWSPGTAKLPKMGDSLPRMPMSHRAKFDGTSFILAGEIRNHTNKKPTNKQNYKQWTIYPHLVYQHMWIKIVVWTWLIVKKDFHRSIILQIQQTLTFLYAAYITVIIYAAECSLMKRMLLYLALALVLAGHFIWYPIKSDSSHIPKNWIQKTATALTTKKA